MRNLEAYTLVVEELSDELFLWQCYLPNEGKPKNNRFRKKRYYQYKQEEE